MLAAPPQAGEQGSNSRLSYRPALDGLRALAVVAVLAYHGGLGWARAGFLGVDVFFVLSGYLITALLLAEWQQEGGIQLLRFWRRRARRLLPALIVMLAAVAVAVPILARDQASRFWGDLLAALGYVSNWRLILENQSYFEAAGRPPILEHLWSLAVEEQFYLLWPLVLVWWLRRHRPRWPERTGRPPAARRLVRPLLAASGVSTLLMALLFEPFTDPSRVYYGTDTRAAALLIGAALACATTRWQMADRVHPAGRMALEVTGVLGLAGLGWAISHVSEFDPALYRGGFLCVALLAAAVVAAAARPGEVHGPLTTALASRPLVWLGRRSYAVYLWFWPVFMLTRPHSDVPFSGLPLLALRVALTVTLAAVSYRLVEQPVRAGGLRRAWVGGLRRAWAGGLNRARAHHRPVRTTRAPVRRSTAAWGLGVAVALTFVGTGVAVSHRPSEPAALSAAEAAGLGLRASQAGMDIRSEGPGLNALVARRVPIAPAMSTTAPPTTAPTTTQVTAPPSTVPVTQPATTETTSPPELPVISAQVTAVSDSVLLGAKSVLESQVEGIVVDAAIGRQFSDVFAVVRTHLERGTVGEAIVVQTGNNGPINPAQFNAMMEALRDVRRVVIVNVKVERSWQDHNNEVIAKGVTRWPNAVIADWHAAASAHPDAFYDDGLHLTPMGMRLFTQTVLSAL